MLGVNYLPRSIYQNSRELISKHAVVQHRSSESFLLVQISFSPNLQLLAGILLLESVPHCSNCSADLRKVQSI